MAIRKINPTSPGQRGMSCFEFDEITTDKPEKSLLEPIRKRAGRNNQGKITCRHKGGGAKRAYRKIDYKREKFGVPGTVKTIEYDPNRNTRISLVFYADGEKRYILTPQNLNVGDVIVAGPEADIKTGNALPLYAIPLGTNVHCIELKPHKGAQIVRTAGGSAQVMAKEGNYVTIKLVDKDTKEVIKESAPNNAAPVTPVVVNVNAPEGCKNACPTKAQTITKYRYQTLSTLPVKLAAIGGHSFAQNTSLKIASIPNNISKIGNGAFANCLSLKVVDIPESVTSIGYNAFFHCPKLNKINYSGTCKQWRKVKRGSNWLANSGTTIVTCSDGALKVNPYK